MSSDDTDHGHSRVVLPSARGMYVAAGRWRDQCLVGDLSLFAGRPIDGRAAAQELVDYYVNRPDEGSGTFLTKLSAQLAPAGPDTVQLAAELLFVHFLIASTEAVRADTKRTQIDTVLAFRSGTDPMPDVLSAALAGGVANPGQAFNSFRWKMFAYLIAVYRAMKELPIDERELALGSFEAFQTFLAGIDDQSVWSQRYALEHLLFPDDAPAVLSRDDRRTIVRAFGRENPDDIRKLVAELEPNVLYGRAASVNLYRTPYYERWSGWSVGPFAEWAAKVLAVPGLLDAERVEVQARLAGLRASSDAADPFPDLAAPALTALVDERAARGFLRWVEDFPDEARRAVREVAKNPGPESIDRFLAAVPPSVLPTLAARLGVASALLATASAELPAWDDGTAQVTRRLIHGYHAQTAATPGEHYVLFLEQLDNVRVLTAEHPTRPIRDRLDAACLMRIIAASPGIESWSETENVAFVAWRSGKSQAGPPGSAHSRGSSTGREADATDGVPRSAPVTVEQLAAGLFMDDTDWLTETLALLDAKKQVILQGPPGTGKTFIARALAEFRAGDPNRVRMVQFHPGTSYEDFVQGLRPVPDNPGAFGIVDGPLLVLAEAARQDPEHEHFLVIDEINRGNIAAIFGELYYLLEYRDRPISLTYGGEFRLPGNLYVIGTMNTADRSITMLDSALRRRFYVRDLRPGQPPVDGVLRRYLTERGGDLAWLADLLDHANALIDDPDQAVGPSHFMVEEQGPVELWARRAWDHTVLPTLREVFYGRADLLTKLEFTALKSQVSGGADDVSD